MERQDVYKIIDGEREYQDTVRRQNEGETRNDKEKCVADFLLYMEKHMNDARTAHYYLNDKKAMSELRKVIALGVAAAEALGMSSREEDEKERLAELKRSLLA